MKKILAYLLVLVSLMTLFCGTAGAEETGAKEIYFTINEQIRKNAQKTRFHCSLWVIKNAINCDS